MIIHFFKLLNWFHHLVKRVLEKEKKMKTILILKIQQQSTRSRFQVHYYQFIPLATFQKVILPFHLETSDTNSSYCESSPRKEIIFKYIIEQSLQNKKEASILAKEKKYEEAINLYIQVFFIFI